MTRWNKLLTACILLIPNILGAQENIFDAENSKQYAQYLFASKEYSLAAQEYERVLFLIPGNDTLNLQLIQSYRLAGDPDKALLRLEAIFPSNTTLSPILASEKGRLLIQTRQLGRSRAFLQSGSNIPARKRTVLAVTTEMLDHNWSVADTLIASASSRGATPVLKSFRELSVQAQNRKHRYQGVAISLSAVVPGAGKAYSGAWKDGLISLAMCSIAAWQSYRGFNKNGTKSTYGWVFGGLAAGFYIGNLYGSGKQAKKYNQQQLDRIDERVEALFNDLP